MRFLPSRFRSRTGYAGGITANPQHEQETITNDRGLWEFHREWFEEMLTVIPEETASPMPAARRTGYSHAGRPGGSCPSCATRRTDAESSDGKRPEKRTPGKWPSLPMNWPPRRSSLARSPGRLRLDDSATGGKWPGPYYARLLAGEVATRLGMPLAEIIQRTDAKRYHGPAASLEQTPYTLTTEAAAAIVLDDLITSGQTMKLSLEALLRGTGPRVGLCVHRELKPCPAQETRQA